MLWYLKVDGKTVGPLEDHVVAAWVRDGRVGPTTRIALEGADSWTSIAQSPFAGSIGKPRGLSTASKVLIALAGVVFLTMSTCAVCVGIGAKQVSAVHDSVEEASKHRTREPTPIPAAVADTPPITVSALDLFRAYSANEVSADDRYKGHRLAIRGVVSQISKDAFNNAYLSLATTNSFESVMAKGLDAGQLAQLSKGNTVSLICTGAGMIIGSPVLDGCSFAQ